MPFPGKPLRTLLLLGAFLVFFNGNTPFQKTCNLQPFNGPELTADTVLKFMAHPEAGYHFSYLIYLPKGLKTTELHYLLVETTNTGLNDSIEFHERGARFAASKSSVGN